MGKLKGEELSVTDLNLAMYGQMDPDEVKVTPESYEKLWAKVKPTVVGKMIITGTAGGAGDGKFFKQIWDEAENKKTK